MAKYDFPSMRRGDSFLGTIFTVKVNGTPLDLSGDCIIRMDLRLTALGTVAKSFTSVANAGITISATPTDGTFTINETIMDIPAGDYLYDIQIKLDTDEIFTFIWGNFPLIQDITYD